MSLGGTRALTPRSASAWNSSDCLVLNRGNNNKQDNDDDPFAKSNVLHQWLFGYDVPDTVLLIRKDGNVWFLATKKKLDFVQPAVKAMASSSSTGGLKQLHVLLRDKKDPETNNYAKLWDEAGIATNGQKRVLGIFLKEHDDHIQAGGAVGPWEQKLKDASTAASENGGTEPVVDLVDVSHGLGFVMSVKDDVELDLLKKSAVLSNKVMKHGYIKRMEEVIDAETSVTHEELATYVEDILEDPSKISLKVPPEDVQSCYHPIVQSGGKYDIRISAQTTGDKLSHDVILVQFGARYRNYCSNIARTFLVDPPKAVSECYELLLELHDACLTAMKPGQPLRSVYKTAVKFLQDRNATYLVERLPKHLGFATGLDFREAALVLSPKNPATFKQGMVFCLSIGFHNIPLSSEDRDKTPDASPIKKLDAYSLLVSDMVAITSDAPDVLTKLGKHLTDVAYNINNDDAGDEGDDDDEDEGEGSDEEDEDADARYARKVAAKERGRAGGGGTRTSSRLAKEQAAQQDVKEGAAERELKQIRLMERRNEERIRELARKNKHKDDGDDMDLAEELEAYKKTRDYPDNVLPNQVRVDMANQCVILPVCGIPVPFHISTIKNVVMPDADGATLLRLNFFTPGVALGKDAPANMVKLVQKYSPYASFIREMTFRSLDGHNLTQVRVNMKSYALVVAYFGEASPLFRSFSFSRPFASCPS